MFETSKALKMRGAGQLDRMRRTGVKQPIRCKKSETGHCVRLVAITSFAENIDPPAPVKFASTFAGGTSLLLHWGRSKEPLPMPSKSERDKCPFQSLYGPHCPGTRSVEDYRSRYATFCPFSSQLQTRHQEVYCLALFRASIGL